MEREMVWERLRAMARNAEEVEEAWRIFKKQPGQEHWRCACSSEEALR